MGILDLLKTGGSTLSKHNGATPPINTLSTKASTLHAKQDGTAGYSLDGNLQGVTSKGYVEYDDGQSNSLPTPSTLDLNGKAPKGYSNPETGTTYP